MTTTEKKKSVCTLVINPDTGKVLLVSRKNDHSDFGLPGGKAEDTDLTLRHAAARELHEETGLVAKVDDLVEIYSDMARTTDCTTYYVVEYTPGDICSSEEGVAKWGDIDEAYNGTYGFYNKKMFAKFLQYVNKMISG